MNSTKTLDDVCPQCSGVVTQKGITAVGETADIEITWYSCLSCDWDNRSNDIDSKQ